MPNNSNTVEDEGVYEIEDIIGFRVKGTRKEYRIKWKGYDIKEATWEDEENIFDKSLIEIYHKQEKRKKNSLKRKEEAKEEGKSFFDKEDVKNTSFNASTDAIQSPKKDRRSLKGKCVDSDEIDVKDEENKKTKFRVNSLTYFQDDESIVAIDSVFRENNKIMAQVRYNKGEVVVYHIDEVHKIAPLKLLEFYEQKMVFSQSGEEKQ